MRPLNFLDIVSGFNKKNTKSMLIPLVTKYLTLLLIIQLNIFAAIPSGVDFVLCFDSDGHINFSASECGEDTAKNIEKEELCNDEDHHGICRDIELSCCLIENDQLKTSEIRNQIPKTQKQSFVQINRFSWFDFLPPQYNSAHVRQSKKGLPPYHLPFLKSIILII